MIKPLVNYLIRRRAKEDERSPSKVHGDLIMHAAIIADASDEQGFQHVRSYVKELRGRGWQTVDLFVVLPNKRALQAFAPERNEHPFYKGDFNWLGKYKGQVLKASVGKSYDVLIDLTRGNAFPADVLIAKTKAQWKAGGYDANRTHLLDFMIDMKEDKDIRKLIHHLDGYLTNLNKSNAA